MLLHMIFGALYDGIYGLLLIAFGCGILPLFYIYQTSMGLKVAWTERRIYMRPQGFDRPTWRRPRFSRAAWRSLSYDEIARIEGVVINDPRASSFLIPIQLLRLSATGTTDPYDDRHIWLYSLALHDKELAPLFHHIDAVRPGLLPAIIRKRLKRWDERAAREL